jgi:hypothetical protein
MKRRESLKLIVTGAVAVPVVVAGCGPDDKKAVAAADPTFDLDRNPAEVENEKRILAMDKFFTDHEIATIAVLSDIIIPKDEVSGSATDAKVPEFIEFIVKDMPNHQTPLRGGLRWLDMQCLNKYNNAFKDCTKQQQIEIIDQIAYPQKAKPEMAQGVSFFNKMRDMVATGFLYFTNWRKRYWLHWQLSYSMEWRARRCTKTIWACLHRKELKECVSFDKAKP